MNIAIYASFSSHTQTEQSIERQLKVCYEYARAHGFNVNVHIRLDIEKQNGQFAVKQTIDYETDNKVYQIIVTDNASTDNEVSVCREGV